MAYRDLRSFLALLAKEGELVKVDASVDPNYEIGAICRKALDQDAPALLMTNVKGSSMPLAVNCFASRRRFALALGTTPARLHQDWLERVNNPIPPILVDSGPCQDIVLTGDDVDLSLLPIPVWNELDGGPYITFPCHISKDPVTGGRNAAMYRTQVHDKRTVGILAAPYRHLPQQLMKAPGKPFPVAIALGLDPVIHIASTATFAFGVDELGMAGALRGAPVELVRCQTIPLEVPAHAEIVLEGELLPGELQAEGLFGEFTGYYGTRAPRPVIRIKAITHRRDPIYLGSYEGKPPQESNYLIGIPIEAEIMRTVSLPGIKAVHLTEGSCGSFTAVVAIEKPFEGYGKMMGMAVLGVWSGKNIKTVIVVDDDIDVFNWTEVEWAWATRVQPHRDVEIIKEVTGIVLDPSLPESERLSGASRTSKMIIDATRFDAAHYEIPCRPHPEAEKLVEERWQEYGIDQKLAGG